MSADRSPRTKPKFDHVKYASELPAMEALRAEVVFILTEAINSAEIKTHAIESRIKSYESLSKKASAVEGSSYSEVNDRVGARVICLFKSDLDRIGTLIEKSFLVRSTDNKIASSEDSFGYMSIHYVCTMKAEYVGPRYDRIRNMVFEIQVRTLCMHAWAAISHYLDYKAEWDIPMHLRKGLNALSGLFYVADEQYETLFAARLASQSDAGSANVTTHSETPINLDTMTAFIHRKYPERRSSDSASVSKFVRDTTEAGYRTIEQIEADLDSVTDKLAVQEEKAMKDHKGKYPFYTAIGAGKVSLRSKNPTYTQVEQKNFKSEPKQNT